MFTDNSQIKHWLLPRPIDNEEIQDCPINITLQKVLRRRGINLEDELYEFLTPTELPNPEDHFAELNKATERIISACRRKEKIAICGDYDADGMTSTVLLVELLSQLGAKAISYIPSRNDDGYGLNVKMINDINIKEINLVITVDNGISAFDAIDRSNKLGIDLIITDHHKISNKNLDIFSLIHPEKSPINSPYKYLAGVGIAYMLGKNICKKLNYNIEESTANVLFCIGTVADMAPLLGANRKWLKECLPKINLSNNRGIKGIMNKLIIDDSDITADDIGYKIAPLINAVGRIGEPNLIVDLLTNKSKTQTQKLVNKCFNLNIERKKMTATIEKEAIEIALNEYNINTKFFVISKRDWHTGIIGIVAARLVDKFNLPTAILSEAKDGIFRGSVRSNNLLKVNLALEKCKHILISFGGHSAAAGFSIKEENIPELKLLLNEIATIEMKDCNLNKFIKPDSYVKFNDINKDFYRQLKLLGPFGIMNPDPIFWTRKCRIIKLRILNGNHLKMILDDGTSYIEAIKWNFVSNLKINDLIDIAFTIEMNRWKNLNKLQLNIVDIKYYKKIIDIHLHKRLYKCQLNDNMEVLITNSDGECLSPELFNKLVYKNKNHEQFAKNILSFAEIALGKSA